MQGAGLAKRLSSSAVGSAEGIELPVPCQSVGRLAVLLGSVQLPDSMKQSVSTESLIDF